MPNLKLLPLSLLLLLSACQSSDHENSDQSDSGLTIDTTAIGITPDTATNSAPESSVNAEWRLVPGKSAGQTQLGETSESVRQRLGPADGGDAAMMHAVSVWYADNPTKSGHTLSIFTVRDAGNDPAARVTQIRVNSPRFQTETGIGAGTPLSKIEEGFRVRSVKEITDKGPAYTLYDDSAAGIAFEVTPDGTCQAVIIHEAGKPFAGSYLTFP